MGKGWLLLLVVMIHWLSIEYLSQMTGRSHAKLPFTQVARTTVVLLDNDERRREQKVEVVRNFEVPEPPISPPPSSAITLPLLELQESESVSPSIDWRAEGEKAVRDALRKEPKSFRPRASPEPDKDTVEPGVFGSQSANRRAGKVETFDDGERHWISDNCYLDFDRRPSNPTLAADLRVQTVRCKGPPTGGGPDMFKDLAPKYLEAEEQKKITQAK